MAIKRTLGLGMLVIALVATTYVVGGTVAMKQLQSTYARIKPGMHLADVRTATHGYSEVRSSVAELDPRYCTPPADPRAKVVRYDLWGLGALGLSIHVIYDQKDRVVSAIDTYE